MKKVICNCFLIFAIIILSANARAQSDLNPARAFKNIHIKETDRHLEQEIKKKELQKAPSLLYIDKTSITSVIKKNRHRRKKI